MCGCGIWFISFGVSFFRTWFFNTFLSLVQRCWQLGIIKTTKVSVLRSSENISQFTFIYKGGVRFDQHASSAHRYNKLDIPRQPRRVNRNQYQRSPHFLLTKSTLQTLLSFVCENVHREETHDPLWNLSLIAPNIHDNAIILECFPVKALGSGLCWALWAISLTMCSSHIRSISTTREKKFGLKIYQIWNSRNLSSS